MTRRTLLSFVPTVVLGAETGRTVRVGRPLQAHGEFFRFADATTENVIVRLTKPTYESLMPEPGNRFVSSRESFLVFGSDRGAGFAPYYANLRTGAITQIAEARQLESRSLALSAHERELYFVDEGILRAVSLPAGRSRTICEGISDFHIAGRNDILVIRQENTLQRWSAGAATFLADNAASRGVVNPTGTGCVFQRQTSETEREFWYVSFKDPKPRLLTKGDISFPYWRPDGEALLFLRQVPRPHYVASVLCEVTTNGSPERSLDETSQFACFAPNGDGSVFVGASRSRVQPDVILLLRSVRREMVLCEHRSSTPRLVSPAFSPNSQRVYFQSDHEGKSSLYSVNVERLVEETEEP